MIVPLRVSIPADANVGDVKKVKVEFKTVNSNNGGMVSMGTGMSVTFDVNVTEKAKKRKQQYDNLVNNYCNNCACNNLDCCKKKIEKTISIWFIGGNN